MSTIEELRDIPDGDVDEVIADYESEGADAVKIPQGDGNWTVRATFPD